MENKTALVTGANRGIGYAVVKELLELGYCTFLTSRDEAKGKAAVEELKALGDLHYHQLDVTVQQSIDDCLNDIREEFGRLDILINNAGINYDAGKRASTVDLSEVDRTLDANLMGPWRMCQAVIPLMKKHGYGRIVNVSSGSGSLAKMDADTPAYGVSKAALNALSIKLGKELKNTGILVNAVCPGWVRTDMGGPQAHRSPEKGAETIVWLAQLPENGPTGKFFRDKEEISF